MKLFSAFAAAMGMASLGVGDVIQGISDSLFTRFEEMSTLCMSSYVGDLCLSPGGLDKVAAITNKETDIHGWVLRDDDTKEIIVVFRGTLSLQNYETDTNYTLASFDILPECEGCQVHGGYYLAWISVVDQVQALLEQQTRQNPGYGVVITGHSLGGSLAALAGAQFASSFDDIQVYTLGEPRTGNAAFAGFVENAYNASSPDTTRFFRCTHENDGIPKEPPASLGYTHHGVEYWSLDPTSAENTYVCTGDAIQCCEAQDGEGINAAHLTYFGHTVIIGADCL